MGLFKILGTLKQITLREVVSCTPRMLSDGSIVYEPYRCPDDINFYDVDIPNQIQSGIQLGQAQMPTLSAFNASEQLSNVKINEVE